METKQIKEILSKIGVTEDNSTVGVWDEDASDYEYIPIYEYIVQAIHKFMNHLEKQKQVKFIMALLTVKDYPNKELSIEYLDSLLEENKRLKEFEDKHISQRGKEINTQQD
mgnify:CR=1 FL=1